MELHYYSAEPLNSSLDKSQKGGKCLETSQFTRIDAEKRHFGPLVCESGGELGGRKKDSGENEPGRNPRRAMVRDSNILRDIRDDDG